MRRSVAVTGPTSPALAWQRYADLSLWSSWAPPIRGVQPQTRLRAGLSGTVSTVVGLTVPFTVLEVDDADRWWSWQVAVGPWQVEMHHEVLPDTRGGSVATLTVDGPAPIAALYPETARLALFRLVH